MKPPRPPHNPPPLLLENEQHFAAIGYFRWSVAVFGGVVNQWGLKWAEIGLVCREMNVQWAPISSDRWTEPLGLELKKRLNFHTGLATCGCIMAPYGPESDRINPLARGNRRP